MKRYRNRVLALLLAAGMLAGMALSSGFTLRSGGSFLTEVFEEEEEGYKTYTNDAVKFTLEYPAGYDLAEPYENLVIISSGNDFRVVAEYAYTTADGSCYIYSAADFAGLIDADRQVLADWLGLDNFEVVNKGHGKIGEKECYEYDVLMELNGNQCSGSLLIFDGKGDFGCYCIQAMVNQDSPDADKYIEQQVHLVDTFQVTGAYQEEGLGRTHIPEFDLDFISGEYNDADYWKDTKRYSIYPLEDVFVEGNVDIFAPGSDPSLDPAGAMDSALKYYFDFKEQTQYVAAAAPVDVGFYDYTACQIRYLDSDRETWMNTGMICFFHDGKYWVVKPTGSNEYMEEINDFTYDILASLRFREDIPESGAAAVQSTETAPEEEPAEEAASAPSEGGYSTYTNDTVGFSFEYPAKLTVTEPYEGAVLMESEDGALRMSAEYAYTTVDGSTLLYSATDFADLIDADPGVLADWLGTDDYTLGYHDRDTSGERARCWYFFQMEQNGRTMDGCLTLFDGAGRFGFYCLQTLCDKQTYGSVEYEQQLGHAQESFQVTKACEVAGFTVRHVDAWALDFLTDDSLVEDVAFESDPQTGETLEVIPAGAGKGDLSILLSPLTYDINEVSMNEAVSNSLDFLLSAKDQAEIVSGPAYVPDVGRYEFNNFVVAYRDGGKTVNAFNTFLIVDGRYWEIAVTFSDGYGDQADTIVSEMVSSLRFA